jgi:hypothetical protein
LRYSPVLNSLSEAREFLIASGLSASEAETDICRALRDGEIRFKHAIERVTFRGHAVHPVTFRRLDRSRFRLRVPADLAPEDLDWENSRPRMPWPLGEGYFAHIARLELSRRNLGKVFSLVEAKASNEAREEASQAEAERKRAEAKRKRKLAEAKRKRKRVKERAAREEASHASDTGRAQPRRYWARKAIDGAYPNGVPTKEEVPNKTFISEVMKFVEVMKSSEPKGWNVGSPDSILREAGRRK